MLPLFLGQWCIFHSLALGACEESYDLILFGGGSLGLGLGFSWWLLRPKDETPSWLLENNKLHVLLVVCVAFLILDLTVWCGRKQIGGFDQSVPIDIGWRMINGQVPYKDFVCTLPPGFYLGVFYAFKIFGVYWQSLALAAGCFGAIAFLWSYWLLGQLLKNRLFALLVGLGCQAISIVLIAFWWYNSITSVSAVLFLLSSAVLLLRPKSTTVKLSFFVSLLVLAAMKPNIAGPLILGVMAILLTAPEVRWRALSLAGLAFAAFILLLGVHHISLAELLQSYTSVSDRVLSCRFYANVWTSNEISFLNVTVILVFLPLCSPESFVLLRKGSRLHWLFVVGAVVGIFGLVSNGEDKLVDQALPLVACTLFACTTTNTLSMQRISFWIRYGGMVLIFLSCVGIAEAVVRARVKLIGMKLFFDFTTVAEKGDGFFKNGDYSEVFNTTRKELKEMLDAIAKRAHRSPKDLKIYFGLRMQWAYAEFDLQSPVNLPVWWEPGVSFGKKDEALHLQQWLKTDFDAVILYKDDKKFFSSAFTALIEKNYLRPSADKDGLPKTKFITVRLPQKNVAR